MYYKVYPDVAGYWRWRFYAANGRILADSGEGYVNRQDCLYGIDLVRGSGNAPIYD